MQHREGRHQVLCEQLFPIQQPSIPISLFLHQVLQLVSVLALISSCTLQLEKEVHSSYQQLFRSGRSELPGYYQIFIM